MKKFWKVFRWVLLAILVLFGGLVVFFLVTEYKPVPTETLKLEGQAQRKTLSRGDRLSLVSWNLGFFALGDNADFFMDGGKSIYPADRERVEENIEGIQDALAELDPDFILLQEVDEDSDRSYHINGKSLLQAAAPQYVSSFAYNFNTAFVPYPIPPIGKVRSGILTLSKYDVREAVRTQLPIPFKWPVSVFNLKRCLMTSRLKAGEKELVLVNLHLEAYDDGEGKLAQTKMLRELLEEEAAKGNYVIAGGDFNQTFSSVDASLFPAQEGKWQSGILDSGDFSENWSFLMNGSVPSCRSLDQAYAGADKNTFQYYVIDGFIVSSNVTVEDFEVVDKAFQYSDHNPVLLRVRLD